MMDKDTLKALKASIKHWEKNVAATTPDEASVYSEDCALCRKFDPVCDGCPVMARTGREDCIGTPYKHAAKALRAWDRDWEGDNNDYHLAAFRVAAEAELAFLKSLLPKKGEQA